MSLLIFEYIYIYYFCSFKNGFCPRKKSSFFSLINNVQKLHFITISLKIELVWFKYTSKRLHLLFILYSVVFLRTYQTTAPAYNNDQFQIIVLRFDMGIWKYQQKRCQNLTSKLQRLQNLENAKCWKYSPNEWIADQNKKSFIAIFLSFLDLQISLDLCIVYMV